MGFEKGNNFGKGRPPGSKNKKTKLRTEVEREFLEETKVLQKMVLKVLESYEAGTLTDANAIKAFNTFAPYYMNTVSNDQIDDLTAETMTPEEAQKTASEMASKIRFLFPAQKQA
ncbi:hypothetical protein CB599_11655 [Salmonella enterica subsp. enterica serovar Adjame]|nr:hypothetical protein [Salmonella enterica subsp. enterica serovar Adjame]